MAVRDGHIKPRDSPFNPKATNNTQHNVWLFVVCFIIIVVVFGWYIEKYLVQGHQMPMTV